MNVQNDEQQFQLEDPTDNVQLLQVTGCTAGNLELYNQVQNAIDCTIGSEGPNVSSLGQAVLLADIANQPPVSCMLNLLKGQYSDCGTTIPSNLRKAAFDAFTEVTGFKSFNNNQAFNIINSDQKAIVNCTAFYFFIPMLILLFIGVSLLVGFSWINWVAGLFLIVLIFIILYGATIAYRIKLLGYLNTNNNQLQQDVTNTQNNFENSVAYWPQGLFAVACAITATGGTGSWSCNEVNPCDINNDCCVIEKQQPSKSVKQRRIKYRTIN